tara:strand:- start:4002 stop:4154 length:153 start_codon:yes stop_codon:yes gene_type:complete
LFLVQNFQTTQQKSRRCRDTLFFFSPFFFFQREERENVGAEKYFGFFEFF